MIFHVRSCDPSKCLNSDTRKIGRSPNFRLHKYGHYLWCTTKGNYTYCVTTRFPTSRTNYIIQYYASQHKIQARIINIFNLVLVSLIIQIKVESSFSSLKRCEKWDYIIIFNFVINVWVVFIVDNVVQWGFTFIGAGRGEKILPWEWHRSFTFSMFVSKLKCLNKT